MKTRVPLGAYFARHPFLELFVSIKPNSALALDNIKISDCSVDPASAKKIPGNTNSVFPGNSANFGVENLRNSGPMRSPSVNILTSTDVTPATTKTSTTMSTTPQTTTTTLNTTLDTTTSDELQILYEAATMENKNVPEHSETEFYSITTQMTDILGLCEIPGSLCFP